jgi:hypothetical protein
MNSGSISRVLLQYLDPNRDLTSGSGSMDRGRRVKTPATIGPATSLCCFAWYFVRYVIHYFMYYFEHHSNYNSGFSLTFILFPIRSFSLLHDIFPFSPQPNNGPLTKNNVEVWRILECSIQSVAGAPPALKAAVGEPHSASHYPPL